MPSGRPSRTLENPLPGARMKAEGALPPTYLFAALVLMAIVHWLVPVAAILAWPYNLLGGVLLAAGVALNLTADAALKKHGTTVKPFQKSTALITTGVFRISRHPMYLGMVLMLLGIAVLAGTLSPFVVVAVFGAVMHLVFVRTEERMLERQFGEAWLDYKRRVRPWV